MIALITDFGIEDVYVGLMKTVIAERAPGTPVIDLSHAIQPQDIAGGSFALACAFPYLPSGTIVVALIDPGVGSERRRVAVEVAGRIIVAPDNGIVTDLLREERVTRAFVLDRPELYRTPEPSATFEGRDVFAPVAAALASGVLLDDIGTPLVEPNAALVRLPSLTEPYSGDVGVHGSVRMVDHFGNIVTDLRLQDLPQTGSGWYRVRLGDAAPVNVPLARTYSDVAPGELCLLRNSFGRIELSRRNGDAAETLGGVRAPLQVIVSAE